MTNPGIMHDLMIDEDEQDDDVPLRVGTNKKKTYSRKNPF